jgi:hypothetical protein
MNLERIQRIAYRECTKSPLKTGILLALCPLALYFIAPLVWPGKLSSRSNQPKRAQVLEQASAISVPAVTVAAARTSGTLPAWQEIVRWRQLDRFATPAASAGTTRDPFKALEDDAPAAPKAAPDRESERPDVNAEQTPEEFGIALTATVVSPRTRLATINGMTYREGALVPIEANEPSRSSHGSKRPSFRLLKIQPNHVVLERFGNEHVLKLPRKQLARAGELTLRGPSP